MAKRLNCNLADDVADALEALAARYECSVTEAVRKSISTQHFLDDEVAKGAKVLIANGTELRELVWP